MAELSQDDIDQIISNHAPGFVVAPTPDAAFAVPATDATAPDHTAGERKALWLESESVATRGLEAIPDPLIAVRIMPNVTSDAPSPPLTRTVIINTNTRQVESEQG
jgi:hypothetical protein